MHVNIYITALVQYAVNKGLIKFCDKTYII